MGESGRVTRSDGPWAVPPNAERAAAWLARKALERGAHRFQLSQSADEVLDAWEGEPITDAEGLAYLASAIAGLSRWLYLVWEEHGHSLRGGV